MLLPFVDRVNDSIGPKKMEEVAFGDWPGQPVDLTAGTNSWLPAYGFQTPTSLLEKEDFIGNPDAEYFLHCASSGHYMYLETILEETSDDLRSESDADSRGSPMGWLATDSESGSVICVEQPDAEADCESDREIACPAKRRKQEFFLGLPDDNELTSLSRSSSLLQFETLEKQCQEVCSSSPSIYSQFSYDSLEATNNQRTSNVSPDSLNSPRSETEDESDFYRSLKIEAQQKSSDSLLYNATRFSGSDSSDSDVTLEASRSFDNLRTWRSYDSLLVNGSKGAREKVSVENLSEDSGYGDNLTSKGRDEKVARGTMNGFLEKECSYVGFPAYDGEVLAIEHMTGNFGISYQDLTVFKDDRLDVPKFSPLIERFVRSKRQQLQQQRRGANGSDVGDVSAASVPLNLDDSKFRQSSCSEPDLIKRSGDSQREKAQVCVSSVPKDLNFIGEFNGSASESVAAKNWTLEDLLKEENADVEEELLGEGTLVQDVTLGEDQRIIEEDEGDEGDEEDETMAYYKREGSYDKAMSNRVDLSDDEHSLINRNKIKLPRTTIVDFDRKVLKAISEQSLQSLRNSALNVQDVPAQHFLDETAVTSTPISSMERRNIASTPNLAASNQFEPVNLRFREEERRKSVENLRRKSSIIKSSTSTSGISDNDDKTLEESIKSYGSNLSKGVHFSPVVSEVNWRDSSISTVTPDRESIYSFGSSSPERRRSPTKELVKPRARMGTPVGLSFSQPELHEEEDYKKEFVNSLKSLRQDLSKSQPDVARFARRGSQLIKKDKDGSVIKAYVDRDGIQYKHTHLDIAMAIKQHQQQQQQHHQQQQHQQLNSPPHHQHQQHRIERGENALSKSVETMEARDAFRTEVGHAQQQQHQHKRKKASGKIGGFFSRLASFRFSLKKGAEEKAKIKKKGEAGLASAAPKQRIATKDDYIYIPLKGPPSNNNNNNNNNSQQQANRSAAATSTAATTANGPSLTSPASKPPLPRVVHASVKKDQNGEQQHQQHHHRHRRRRTIDSACGGGGGGGGGVSNSMEPMGLIETDLDTEVTVITSGDLVKTTRSLLDLGHQDVEGGAASASVGTKYGGRYHPEQQGNRHRPHKSMEFLLDKENLKVVEPPENELQKGERVMSEHQLRVQRSLQKLTVPEWYKPAQVPREGFLLKKGSPRESRWTGTGSKTTSLSSLGSNPHSPLVLSPTPFSQPFVRWSTSKLNSTASSPCASTRSSFNSRQPNGSISPSSARSSFSYRQPYMGWRSQERLNRPRTPAERLASSLLASQQHQHHNHHQQQQQQQESPEIQTSIKEVTSAIVHYVSGLRPEEDPAGQRSHSVSPRGSQKLCWLESSFVGTKPLDSPQTPVTLSTSSDGQATPVPPASLRLDLQAHNGKSLTA